jgi:hypothetical protein
LLNNYSFHEYRREYHMREKNYAYAEAEARVLGQQGHAFFAEMGRTLLFAESRIATSPNPRKERLEVVNEALQTFEVEKVPDVLHQVHARLCASQDVLSAK